MLVTLPYQNQAASIPEPEENDGDERIPYPHDVRRLASWTTVHFRAECEKHVLEKEREIARNRRNHKVYE